MLRRERNVRREGRGVSDGWISSDGLMIEKPGSIAGNLFQGVGRDSTTKRAIRLSELMQVQLDDMKMRLRR